MHPHPLHRTLPLAALLILILTVTIPLSAEERSWTNSGGKTIVATLVEIAGESAVLQMNGNNFEVPIATLSPTDQEFIRNWKKSDMTDPSKDGEIKANWDSPWPKLVSIDIDQEIEVLKEDEAAKEYIYASPHYEFICDVKLNTSLVKRFSLLFEATNQVCRELPLGMVKPFRQERHKIHLFETREAYISKGGPPDSAGVYISRGGEGDILIPLTSLGVKKVGSNYSVDYDKENTTLSHEIAHQLTDVEWPSTSPTAAIGPASSALKTCRSSSQGSPPTAKMVRADVPSGRNSPRRTCRSSLSRVTSPFSPTPSLVTASPPCSFTTTFTWTETRTPPTSRVS